MPVESMSMEEEMIKFMSTWLVNSAMILVIMGVALFAIYASFSFLIWTLLPFSETLFWLIVRVVIVASLVFGFVLTLRYEDSDLQWEENRDNKKGT